jgi:hypothetical protein
MLLRQRPCEPLCEGAIASHLHEDGDGGMVTVGLAIDQSWVWWHEPDGVLRDAMVDGRAASAILGPRTTRLSLPV